VIPPGSFAIHRDGRFEFEGVIDGVELEVQIASLGSNSFTFRAEARGVNLTGLTNNLPVAIAIGTDTGNTTTSNEEKDEGAREDRDRSKDNPGGSEREHTVEREGAR
jgi:hypothetical protein